MGSIYSTEEEVSYIVSRELQDFRINIGENC